MPKLWQELTQRKGIGKIRTIVQTGFLLFIIYVTAMYIKFISAVQAGNASISMRPPAVEGFLPIAGYMDFFRWLLRGEYDPVNPAAFFIFAAIIISALIFRKGFCSWFCPVGTFFEWIGRLGEKLFKKQWQLPKYLDYPLRALKYILLAAFTMIALIGVNYVTGELYDVGLYAYWFLSGPGAVFIIGMIILIGASLLVRNFWCRYLCPYGALMGLVALISPFSVKREADKCINCGKCTRACPSGIKVAEKDRVNTPECTSCMNCIKECPVDGALGYKFAGIKGALPLWAFPVMLLAVFIILSEIAKMTGHWQTLTTLEQYVQTLKQY